MSFDFLRSDEAVGSYEDFMQSLSPAYSGVSATGVALTGFGSAGAQFASGDWVGGSLQSVQTAISLIGRGRREADEITAVQTPVSALLEQVNTEMGAPNITRARLITLREAVVAAGGQLQEVLARPWADGRAAEQCKATMFGNPGYLRVTIENIDKLLRPGGSTPTTGSDPGAGAGALLAGAAVLYAIFG